MVFKYIFDPTAAWGAVGIVFLGSIATKMLQLAFDVENERFCWQTFRNNFSSIVGLTKFTAKVALFAALMMIIAQGKRAAPFIFNYAEPGVLSVVFVYEAINCMTHLSDFPSLKKLISAIRVLLVKALAREVDIDE